MKVMDLMHSERVVEPGRPYLAASVSSRCRQETSVEQVFNSH